MIRVVELTGLTLEEAMTRLRETGASAFCIGYTRVSTEEQKRTGFSISMQLDAIVGFLRNQELDCVLGSVADPGHSGDQQIWKVGRSRSQCRPGLTLVADLCDAGMVSHLVVYNVSRICRNPRVWFELKEDHLEPARVELLSVNDPVGSGSASEFATNMLVMAASHQRLHMRSHSKHGMERRARSGYPICQYGFGWEPASVVDEGGYVGVKSVQELRPIIAEVYERYLRGETPTQIARWLTAIKAPTRFGGKWWEDSVQRILKNPINAGLVNTAEGEVVRGAHYAERIIEELMYCEVVEKLALLHAQRIKRPSWDGFTFNGLVRCAKCGWPMRLAQFVASHTVYHCEGKRGPCKHGRLRVDAALVEQYGARLIQKILSGDRLIGEVQHSVRRAIESALRESQDAMRRLEALDWDLRQEVMRLSGIDCGDDDAAEKLTRIVDRLQDIADERDSTRVSAARLQRLLTEADSDLRRVDGLAVERGFNALTLAGRRAVIGGICRQITLIACGSHWQLEIESFSGERYADRIYIRKCAARGKGIEDLSPLTLLVAREAIAGHRPGQIARRIQMDPSVVSTYLWRIKKATGAADLAEALKKMARVVARRSVEISAAQEARSRKTRMTITDRERRILALLRAGLMRKEIAAELDMTPTAVEHSVNRLYAKLNVTSKAEALQCNLD